MILLFKIDFAGVLRKQCPHLYGNHLVFFEIVTFIYNYILVNDEVFIRGLCLSEIVPTDHVFVGCVDDESGSIRGAVHGATPCLHRGH